MQSIYHVRRANELTNDFLKSLRVAYKDECTDAYKRNRAEARARGYGRQIACENDLVERSLKPVRIVVDDPAGGIGDRTLFVWSGRPKNDR